jgi:hypothetical protein
MKTEYPEKNTDLPPGTDKIFYIIFYRGKPAMSGG